MMIVERIRFGPAGLGGAKTAVSQLEKYSSMGIKACEISFTYSVYIKEDDAKIIGEAAKKLGIILTIHAPYFVNLNSSKEEKIESSRRRLLRCLEIGTYLKAKYVVFHSGFYGKDTKEQTFENIKNQMLILEGIRKEKGYTPKLAPETMGKINVFGSIEEIARLVSETGCHACIDFAHILARSGGDYRFKEVFKAFGTLDEYHIHFSGIEYGEKGEKNHKLTTEDEWRELLENLPKNKDVIVINESPSPIDDSRAGLEVYKSIHGI